VPNPQGARTSPARKAPETPYARRGNCSGQNPERPDTLLISTEKIARPHRGTNRTFFQQDLTAVGLTPRKRIAQSSTARARPILTPIGAKSGFVPNWGHSEPENSNQWRATCQADKPGHSPDSHGQARAPRTVRTAPSLHVSVLTLIAVRDLHKDLKVDRSYLTPSIGRSETKTMNFSSGDQVGSKSEKASAVRLVSGSRTVSFRTKMSERIAS